MSIYAKVEERCTAASFILFPILQNKVGVGREEQYSKVDAGKDVVARFPFVNNFKIYTLEALSHTWVWTLQVCSP